MTFASTHPTALAVHSGSVTDTPRPEGAREVPLTGCQVCIAPHYLLPHSFGQEYFLGEEGEVNDGDEARTTVKRRFARPDEARTTVKRRLHMVIGVGLQVCNCR